MAKYRKIPVVIEAMQFMGGCKNIKEVLEFMGQKVVTELRIAEEKFYDYCNAVDKEGLKIDTLEGVMTANKGDWIIKGVNGEFYPCKPDIFAKTYEAIKE